MASVGTGDDVQWKRDRGTGTGTIGDRFTENAPRTIKGIEATRIARDDHPVVLIGRDDGDEAPRPAGEHNHADG